MPPNRPTVGRPKVIGGQSPSGAGLQVPDDASGRPHMSRDNHVYVIGQNTASMNPISALARGLGETVGRGKGLPAR